MLTLFLEPTKKLNILYLLLCSSFTLYMPNCVIVVWLYIFGLMFVSLLTTNFSIVSLANNFLYMYNGIIFPPLAMSTYMVL